MSDWKPILGSNARTSEAIRERMNYFRWKIEQVQPEKRSIWFSLRKKANGALIDLESNKKKRSVPTSSVSEIVGKVSHPGELPVDSIIDSGSDVMENKLQVGDQILVIKGLDWIQGRVVSRSDDHLEISTPSSVRIPLDDDDTSILLLPA